MFEKLFSILKLEEPAGSPENTETHTWALAAAALMIEVATADQNFDNSELDALLAILSSQFSLTPEQLNTLVTNAKQQSSDATSLYQFTRQVNDSCTHKEKFRLVTGMWQVAYADGAVDKYEEHIIRRISDLMHLPHSQYIRAKQEARNL